MNCKKCNAPLKEGAKFCTRCGAAQDSQKQTASENFNVIKNRIYWNIQPGVVAQQINESEFTQYDTTQGVIINEGTTAYIKAGGRLLAEVKGGCYDFVPNEELEKILDREVGGAHYWLRGHGKFLMNLLWSKSVRDNVNIQEEREREVRNLGSLKEVIAYSKKDQLFSIVLKQDREFQLVLGSFQEQDTQNVEPRALNFVDSYMEHYGLRHIKDNDSEQANRNMAVAYGFEPMTIKTKFLDIPIAIKAFFRIEDFETFSNYYLTERNYVSATQLAADVSSTIKSLVQDVLKDEVIEETVISNAIKDKIAQSIGAVNFHGLVLANNIIDVAIRSEELERMRELARVMYLQESEISYLQRSYDFRNRLNTINAQQKLQEATSELESYKVLAEINKDKILFEEEMKRFYNLLEQDKLIRSARSQSELDGVIVELRKTGLLREEELMILEGQIEEGRINRQSALDLLNLQRSVEYEKVRLGAEKEIQLQDLTHELNMRRAEIEFENEQYYKELQRQLDATRENHKVQNEQVLFETDIAERSARFQMERMRAEAMLDDECKERESLRNLRANQQIMDHNYRIAQEEQFTERQRLAAQENMSASQLMAQNIGSMDASAQAAFANSFNNMDAAHLAKQSADEKMALMQQMLAMQQSANASHTNDLKEMMRGMMSTVACMSNNMVQSKNEQREEYREQLHREQDRHDAHQEIALDYTTRGGTQRYCIPNPGTSVHIATNTQDAHQTCPNLNKVNEKVDK